eukprot:190345_1
MHPLHLPHSASFVQSFGAVNQSPSAMRKQQQKNMSTPPQTHHRRVDSDAPVRALPTLPPAAASSHTQSKHAKIKPLALKGANSAILRSKSADKYSKTPQPKGMESVLAVAVPPKVHNMLRQSHSPITPAHDIQNIEFEFDPNNPRQQLMQNNRKKYQSRKHTHTHSTYHNKNNSNTPTSNRNQTMFIQPRTIPKSQSNIRISAKDLPKSCAMSKALTPKPHHETKFKMKARSDEGVAKMDSPSESDSSATESDSSSCASSSPSSEHQQPQKKRKQSKFVIKNMRYAQSRSPRFDRGLRRRKNKRNAVTMPQKKLGIIKANKKDEKEENVFTFDDDKMRRATSPRAYTRAMATMSKSARVLSDRREERGMSYADYKRMRRNKEDSWEWICGDQIGKGAFGTVYKGYVISTGKLIAIKEFKYTFGNKRATMQLFEKETQIMKQLKHANIVEFFDYKLVENNRLLYLIMEYVPGNSIESIYMKRGTFSEITIQKYVYQLICGLDYAHSRNIIHRDIKGKNILIDNKGIVKIADFGSAILTQNYNKEAKQNAYSMDFESTPLWTAPEVLTDGTYDLKIDIWSTGCVMIEMATAQRPWNEINFKSPFQALYHIGNTDAIPAW